MTSLLLILQLVLSFSKFIFVTKRCVAPKIQTKNKEPLPFARFKLESIAQELKVVGEPINDRVAQGVFE